MGKLNFDSQGKLIGINHKLFDRSNQLKLTSQKSYGKKHNCEIDPKVQGVTFYKEIMRRAAVRPVE